MHWNILCLIAYDFSMTVFVQDADIWLVCINFKHALNRTHQHFRMY
jgi:hypothetical protein